MRGRKQLWLYTNFADVTESNIQRRDELLDLLNKYRLLKDPVKYVLLVAMKHIGLLFTS